MFKACALCRSPQWGPAGSLTFGRSTQKGGLKEWNATAGREQRKVTRQLSTEGSLVLSFGKNVKRMHCQDLFYPQITLHFHAWHRNCNNDMTCTEKKNHLILLSSFSQQAAVGGNTMTNIVFKEGTVVPFEEECHLHSSSVNLNGAISEWMEACNSTQLGQQSDLHWAQGDTQWHRLGNSVSIGLCRSLLGDSSPTSPHCSYRQCACWISKSPNKKSPSFEGQLTLGLFFHIQWDAFLNWIWT